MAAPKIKAGIIGCGKISPAYMKGCRQFDILDVVACSDLIYERAETLARDYGIPHPCRTNDDLLSDPKIQIVINLTWPKAHAEVSLSAIAAGKNVHSEKPLGITRAEGRQIMEAAKERGLRVGCAPDTFLGGGQQTARKVLDDGVIGRPVAAVAFFAGHGPESWHPNPGFYYEKGGGPMLDMGPYYLTALVNLLGPIKRVTGFTGRAFAERIATCKEHYGEHLPVEVSTHVTGALEFANGALGTLITSFDVWYSSLPRIEIYGTEGSMSVPDPNIFGGQVMVCPAGSREWRPVPLSHSDQVGRGIGAADMAYALAYGREHRANGALAYHVLDAMEAFEDACASGQAVVLSSTCSRPAPLPVGLAAGELDR